MIQTDAAANNAALKVTTGGIISAGFNLLLKSFWRALPIWLVAIVLLTGTNLVDLVYGGAKLTFTPLQIVSLTIRVFASFLIPAVAFRIFIGSKHGPWNLNRDFWLFLLVSFVLTALSFAAVIAVKYLTQPILAQLIVDQDRLRLASLGLTIATFVVMAVVLIKVSLWPVAIVIGDRDVTLLVAWRRMRGAAFALIGALLAGIVPIFIAHVLLTSWAQSLPVDGDLRFQITVVDGIVSVFQVLVGTAMTATAYVLLAARAKAKPIA